MATHKFYQISAVAVLAALPAFSQGVVFQATGDPTFNSTAPTGTLANSGWQYELSWLGGFLATPIGPNYFLSAAHINGVVGSQIWLPGSAGLATVTSVQSFGTDLKLFQIDKTFLSYAPLYNATTDGSEVGKTAVIIGRGGPRGPEVHVGNTPSGALLGWSWNDPGGASDNIERWGENKITGTVTSQGPFLYYAFDGTGSANTVGTNEAGLVAGDSAGGLFINVGGQWKLAGINYGTSNYSYTAGGPTFAGALYDTRGLFDTNGNVISGPNPIPSNSFDSQVSAFTSTISTIINLPPTWSSVAGGSWGTTSTNFANGTPGNGSAGAVVDFRFSITGNSTVTLSGPKTVGTLDFDNTNSYTLSSSTITLDTTSSSTPAQINVASGSHAIASLLTVNKDLNINIVKSSSTLTLSGQMSASGRTITQVGLGSVAYKNVRAQSLVLQQGNAKILPDGSTNGTSVLTTLTVPSGSSLDLTNNDLVINSGTVASWTASVVAGRNGGAWNGSSGINSSTASTTAMVTGLGIASAGDVLGFASGTKTWSGQTVTPSSILIKYTYVGDVNLDGVINGDDYFRIDQGFSAHSTGYAAGDVNFDGRIDGDDYFLMDSNYSRQFGIVLASPASDFAAGSDLQVVPEPGCISLIAAIVSILPLRRKRPR